MSNIVAVVGRPNVGKSTLFNRLTESKDAIVDEVSGVTRDRHYGSVVWRDKAFSVIDTGGYVEGSKDVYEVQIREQVKLAIDEADIILFVVDANAGVTDLDESVANMLRKVEKPVFLVANKVDNYDRLAYTAEFYKLGLGDPISISAINGSGTGELLDALTQHISDQVEANVEEVPRLAVVGRPNVGKSSFINALLGEQRNMVASESGTTRDALDVRYNRFGFDFILSDTAGIRKKSKVHGNIEFYSVLRSIRSIENSDVCLLMIDAERGLEKQDLSIFYTVEKNKKGVVILVNKWDLIEKDTHSVRDFEKNLKEKMAPFTDVPVVFTSVLNKQRIHKALEMAIEVYKNRKQKISTSALNKWMQEVVKEYPPPQTKGKYVKIKYVTQLPTPSPSFAFFCNLPQYVKESYKRYIENKLRKHYVFTGVPIRIFFRKK